MIRKRTATSIGAVPLSDAIPARHPGAAEEVDLPSAVSWTASRDSLVLPHGGPHAGPSGQSTETDTAGRASPKVRPQPQGGNQ